MVSLFCGNSFLFCDFSIPFRNVSVCMCAHNAATVARKKTSAQWKRLLLHIRGDGIVAAAAAIQMIDDERFSTVYLYNAMEEKKIKKISKKYDCVVVFDVDGKT